MIEMSLTEVIGHRFETEYCYATVTRFDPISETYMLDGYNKELKDPCVWSRKDLSEFGVEVVFSDAEKKMIEETKLTNQVRKDATRLQAAMTAWLNAGSVGR